jgi:hypothetical protein
MDHAHAANRRMVAQRLAARWRASGLSARETTLLVGDGASPTTRALLVAAAGLTPENPYAEETWVLAALRIRELEDRDGPPPVWVDDVLDPQARRRRS